MVAGSVSTAEPRYRTAAAELMASAGLDVHVDMMASEQGIPKGVTLTELRHITEVVPRSRIGVHLVGSPEFVDRLLPRVLPLRPSAVYLPWEAYNNDRARAIRGSGGAAWITVPDNCCSSVDSQWPTTIPPDGLLAMRMN